MKDIIGVAYVSKAVRVLSSIDLDRLLLDARTHNKVMGITGVLLYGDGLFFQYFEGAGTEVDSVYKRIRASSLHTELTELDRIEIAHPIFHKWFMGFLEAPKSLIQKISQQNWDRELPWALDQVPTSAGMQMMMQFVNGKSSVVNEAGKVNLQVGME